MKLKRKFALGALLAISSGPSLAFQEQTSGAPVATPAPAAQVDSSKPHELNVPPPAAGKQEGTEVSIPGLGKLGVLPKMDFGLELLYGANEEPKEVEAEPGAKPVAPEDDLTIRGSIKKSF